MDECTTLIPGVTYTHTQGVVKNIIPAIPSTNAVVAAACTLETLKMATMCSPGMNNYMLYVGSAGVYTHTVAYERDPECMACSPGIMVEMGPDTTLQAGPGPSPRPGHPRGNRTATSFILYHFDSWPDSRRAGAPAPCLRGFIDEVVARFPDTVAAPSVSRAAGGNLYLVGHTVPLLATSPTT